MAFGDLCTLEDVKYYLQSGTGNPPPSYDWTLITDLITGASDWIYNWLGRYLPLADYEDICDGTGGHAMCFANYPVVSVASVYVDARPIPPAANSITAGYQFRETKIIVRGWEFSRGVQNVVLQYRAGYTRIPPAARQACIEFVASRYRDRSRLGVVQENIVGVQSETYKLVDMTPATRTALERLCNVVAISSFSRRLATTQTDAGIVAAAL